MTADRLSSRASSLARVSSHSSKATQESCFRDRYVGDFWRRYDDQQTQTDFDAAGRAPGYEKALWGWWDVPDYARTLLNVPLVRAHHDDLPFLSAARALL